MLAAFHFSSFKTAHVAMLAIAALLPGGYCMAATTVTLQPDSTSPNDGDTFVTPGPTNALGNNNYGGAGALEVSGTGMSKGQFQSTLRFDTSTAASSFTSAFGAGNWSIDSIALQLTVANPNNAIFNANTAGQFLVQWMQSDSWGEGTGTPAAPTSTGLTWNTFASILGAGLESEGTFSYNGEAVGTALTFNLTPTNGLMNDILGGRQASFDLSAISTGMSALFNSRNNGVAGNRPALVITASLSATPEPGRALLLLAGTVAIAIRRRRISSLLTPCC